MRIEDTDRERSTEEAVEKLFEAMKWLGLGYDGEALRQSGRSGDHADAAERLLTGGRAYKPAPKGPDDKPPVIFALPWDTDNHPNVAVVGNTTMKVHPGESVTISRAGVSFAQVSRKGKPMPTSASLAGFHELKVLDAQGKVMFELENELDDILNAGRRVILSDASEFSFQRREVFFKDAVKGRLAKPLDTMKDLVIARGDGSPVFHLANVVDDAAQNVTHVIRGDDHVENTFRHVLLFRALDWEPPSFAHLPMIVNKAGKPYSKRDGDAFVGEFKWKGFLPEALFNYLALLGWSPGDDREMMTKEELIEAFSLERVLASPAKFDLAKLTNLNGRFIAHLASAEFAERVAEFAVATGREHVEKWRASNPARFAAVAELAQPRSRTLAEVDSWRYFFEDVDSFDSGLASKILDPGVLPALSALADALGALREGATAAEVESILRMVEAECGLGEGKLNRPARFAATGQGSGPDLDKSIALIGAVRVAGNIRRALESVS